MPVNRENLAKTLQFYADVNINLASYYKDRGIKELINATHSYVLLINSLKELPKSTDSFFSQEDTLETLLQSADVILLQHFLNFISLGKTVFIALAENDELKFEVAFDFDLIASYFNNLKLTNIKLEPRIESFLALKPKFFNEELWKLQNDARNMYQQIRMLPDEWILLKQQKHCQLIELLKPNSDKLPLSELLILAEAEYKVANILIQHQIPSALANLRDATVHLSTVNRKFTILEELRSTPDLSLNFRELFLTAENTLFNICYTLNALYRFKLTSYQLLLKAYKTMTDIAMARNYPLDTLNKVNHQLYIATVKCGVTNNQTMYQRPQPRSNTVEENRWPKPAKPSFP